jgi:CDP-diacylglycerol pyrophosphatase
MDFQGAAVIWEFVFSGALYLMTTFLAGSPCFDVDINSGYIACE